MLLPWQKMKHGMERTQLPLGCEFAVASQLFFNGYYASVTLKNYPKIDIFVTNPQTGKSIGLNVKGMGSNAIHLPDHDDGVMKVYVDARNVKSLHFYVIPSKDEPILRETSLKEWRKTHPKAGSILIFTEFEELSQYENRWDLLGL